ncbi:MAG: hypothetical protein ACP5F8_00290 [Candidatus Aenigmatarchaeota archaeon]
MKAQTQVIQFVLFFILSFSIFSLILNFFYSSSFSFQDRVLTFQRETLASYVSSYVTYIWENCRYCNSSFFKIAIPSKLSENYHDVYFSNNILYIKSQPLGKDFSSSLHNINQSASFSGYFSSANVFSYEGLNKTFALTNLSFNKIQNKFNIGG